MKPAIRAEIAGTDLKLESLPGDGGLVLFQSEDGGMLFTPNDCRALGLALLVFGSQKGQGVALLPDGGVVYGLERAVAEAEFDGILDNIKWVFDDE